MTICEICERETSRRTRLDDGRLVCWQCNNLKKQSYDQICNTVQMYNEYASRGWNKVDELRKLKSISHTPKTFAFSNPISAVPPIEILEKSILALDIMHLFSNFSEVLGDYYGIEAPRYLISDEKCLPTANATYYWEENKVYSKRETSLKRRTAFHEMWHALERHGIVEHTEDSEKNAKTYAKGCLRRLKHDENS